MSIFTKMKSHQINYDMIPRYIIRKVCRLLTPVEKSVLIPIMDKSFGYQKDFCRLTYKDLADEACLCENTVKLAIESLEKYGIITVEKATNILKGAKCSERVITVRDESAIDFNALQERNDEKGDQNQLRTRDAMKRRHAKAPEKVTSDVDFSSTSDVDNPLETLCGTEEKVTSDVDFSSVPHSNFVPVTKENLKIDLENNNRTTTPSLTHTTNQFGPAVAESHNIDKPKQSHSVEPSKLSEENPLLGRLIEAGVGRKVAEFFVNETPEEAERQLKFLPFVTDAEIKTSRAAYLTHAIQNGYGPPAGYEKSNQAMKRRTETPQDLHISTLEKLGFNDGTTPEQRLRGKEIAAETARRLRGLRADRAKTSASPNRSQNQEGLTEVYDASNKENVNSSIRFKLDHPIGAIISSASILEREKTSSDGGEKTE